MDFYNAKVKKETKGRQGETEHEGDWNGIS